MSDVSMVPAVERIPLGDGSELRLTVAEPASARRGGIVVVHEARGVTDAVRALAGGLAAEGWLAVVPHLFHREGPADEPSDDGEQVRGQVERLSADSVLVDVDATVSWLVGRGVAADQIGVVGFELGGAVAMLVATQRSLGAAVTVAGTGVATPVSSSVPSLVDAAPQLRSPWLGIYAEHATPDEVDQLADAAARAKVATDVVYFPDGRYRFDTDQSAAVEAWSRTLNWFDAHLR